MKINLENSREIKHSSLHPATKRPLIMSEKHKITAKDKSILTIALIIIFVGVLGLDLIGVIYNLSS